MAQLCQIDHEGIPGICYENDLVRLTILPSLGGKVISIRSKPDAYEYLWRQSDRALAIPDYDAVFTDYDISGWDECFPTIYPVSYPEGPWRGIGVPDHGEAWALPWQWKLQGDRLVMSVHSVRLAYHFERSFTLGDDGTLAIRYRVANPTAFPLPVLWSMHPFFNATPTTRILLPPDTRVRVEASDQNHLGGFLAEHPWPETCSQKGGAVDLSRLGPPRAGSNSKLFTTRLSQGWAALYDPLTERYSAFTFDPAEVPYVGICTIRGGWPDRGQPAYTVILEPCKGWPDRLDLAVSQGGSFTIAPYGACNWDVRLHLGRGQAELERSIGHAVSIQHNNELR